MALVLSLLLLTPLLVLEPPSLTLVAAKTADSWMCYAAWESAKTKVSADLGLPWSSSYPVDSQQTENSRQSRPQICWLCCVILLQSHHSFTICPTRHQNN